ncbi:MAG: ribulose-phosphate 3-epimerase [Thermodesulfobacteriota bacterium]
MSKLIAPSILSADFTKLGEEVNAITKAGADWIHVDVMDGHFVPQISLGVPIIKALGNIPSPPMDIHLMIDNPDGCVETYIRAGEPLVKGITVQFETCKLLHSTISKIKSHGVMAGIALNPLTPLSVLEEIYSYVDLILIMTVEPGFAGQEFIKSMVNKVKQLRNIVDRLNHKPLIEVDGGVKLENINDVARAGADVFVSGSGIFGTNNYSATIKAMRRFLENS